jgi:hypothetical protein
MHVLRQGGDRSKFGKVRKAWRDHLGITEEELENVLLPLRVKHSYDDEQRLKENLNNSLLLGGLKSIPDDERASKYVNLIQQLHKEGKNIITREDLQEICAREGLLSPEKKNESEVTIGIRSFQRGAENLHLEVHSILCLQHRFIGRFVLEEVSWNDDIRPAIQNFSETVRALKKPLVIHLDTHLSCALYFGYCLDPKYGGLDVTIIQKTNNGKLKWRPTGQAGSTASNWDFKEEVSSEDHPDIAIALSVTKDIKLDVDEHFTTHGGSIGKIFHATIRPGVSNSSIKDADQIMVAVQELLTYINTKRRGKLKSGRVHLFLAAPNAFAFFLGQLIKPLGEVVLYEFDFEKVRGGNYEQVITITNH